MFSFKGKSEVAMKINIFVKQKERKEKNLPRRSGVGDTPARNARDLGTVVATKHRDRVGAAGIAAPAGELVDAGHGVGDLVCLLARRKLPGWQYAKKKAYVGFGVGNRVAKEPLLDQAAGLGGCRGGGGVG